MRLLNKAVVANAVVITLLATAPLLARAAAPPRQSASPSPLTVDTDPVRSPDAGPSAAIAPIRKERGEGYVLKTNVNEVVLNATVVSGSRLVPNLTKNDFTIYEDGVKQEINSFQHTDLPVAMGLVIDNSGSMYQKRPAVNRAALDLVEASNPDDEAFVVNFSDEAFLDQDFTSSIAKLRDGLSHIDSRGGTALYDAIVASADKLAAGATRPKQVLVVITDGEDNASSMDKEQTIRRVQDLSGPTIYSIGLLFGGDMDRGEVRRARQALESLSNETGGMAFFPKNLGQVDEITAEVARDIRTQYTLGYRPTEPMSVPGFRRIEVVAKAKGMGKLEVRTRTGYYPSMHPVQTAQFAQP